MKQHFIQNVVAPIMMMNRSALIGISTKQTSQNGEENWYSECIKDQVVIPYEVTYVCPPCQDLGVTLECKHRRFRKPDHIKSSNNSFVQFFAKDQQFQLEIANISNADESLCFPSHLVDRLIANPPLKLTKPPPFILVSIDPASGSDVASKSTSDFAIFSVGTPGVCIYGSEAVETIRHEQYEQVLFNHLTRLRSLNGCHKTTLVFAIEGNGSATWSYLVTAIRKRFKNVAFLSDYSRKEATNTSAKLKRDALSKTLLRLDADDVRFLDQFVSSDPDIIDKFEAQMRNYRRFVKPNSDPAKPDQVSFSGKGVHKRDKDDLCFTFQRAVYYLEKHQQSYISQYLRN